MINLSLHREAVIIQIEIEMKTTLNSNNKKNLTVIDLVIVELKSAAPITPQSTINKPT